jgi:uncharacterized membrane protein
VFSLKAVTSPFWFNIYWQVLYVAFLYIICIEQSTMTKYTGPEVFLVQISLIAVMSAVTAAATFIVRIPNPMGGYFNLGDVAVFAVALTFNPFVGSLAGGIGSAIADLIGFPVFAIPTLIIKGLEGFLASVISNKKSSARDLLAVVVAGSEMVVGYFMVEYFILQWGLGGALAEIPGNAIQVLVGGLIGVPLGYVVRRRLPEILR